MTPEWSWDPGSIEAAAAVAAAAFTLIAVIVAGLAARYSYRLLKEQTDVSQRLVVIETAREKREQEMHEAQYLPKLSFKLVKGPELIEDESGQYMISFHVHNDGPAPATKVMMAAANHPSGIPIDTYVFQDEIEARMDGIAQLVLPPELVEGKYHSELHPVLFTLFDGATRVIVSEVIQIPPVQPPPGKGGPFDG